MAESLGRIATALELLSSKQDTVIALLQRLADRKQRHYERSCIPRSIRTERMKSIGEAAEEGGQSER
ncbi:unnamed protein product [Pleuronectes platessa]|uniref:Uncharacterized protein n=1 Tax=Pleuronectes platessa TaxID=8262 RepID=A0A9N7TMF1_PLEPL|nr:unnamed protein product [Pleuronectes platessa]